MLQQTQVATVIEYFERFVLRMPDLASLAAAEDDQVMALWAGLGYYSRARNLHRTAQLCMTEHDGELPRDVDALLALPGIGRSTAAAILAQSYGDRHAILDGNVKRVLARYHAVDGWPGRSAVSKRLWDYAEQHTPDQRIADYTQAIMDLGATVCRRANPDCEHCPLGNGCVASVKNLQSVLPTRKPKKTVPVRETWVLFQANRRGELLLEKRPPSGIWGGLWSLPMSEGLGQASAVRQAATLRHTFTHFKLDLKPLLVNVAPVVADNTSRWCSVTDIAKLGLPKPIKQLVGQYFEDQLIWQEPSTV